MESQRLVGRRAETVLLLVLAAATVFTVLFAVDKLAFLSFYQLPVLVAAYLFGRREGVMMAIVSVLMITIYATIDPSVFMPIPGRGPGVALFLWGAFTIVAAYLVGTLYDARTAAASELREAYAGLVDILTELVDAVDRHTDSRSVRVAKLAARIGVALDLPVAEIENLRVAGLLQGVHKVGVSLDVLRKAAHTEEVHSQPGDALRVVPKTPVASGGLLCDVVPLVETYREHYDGSGPAGLAGVRIPLGARILGLAHAFERLTTPEPYGRGMTAPEALMEIEKDAGTQFDPTVVDALILVSESEDLTA